eukprot:10168348-Karenia_brevis.AAC.1
MNCLSNDTVLLTSLCKKVQRTRKHIIGYFGGCISKAQPPGVYELRKSIATLLPGANVNASTSTCTHCE